MSFKIIADTFSVSRDSDHFILLKTLKKPRTEDQVWLAIEIVDNAKYARATAQSIIDTMEGVFFENANEDAYERFENALKEINLIIRNIQEKKGVKTIGSVSAIIGVLSGETLHITQSKNAEAYLIRKGKLSMISEGLTGKSEDLFVNIASGELLPEDKVIFATSRLLRLATQSQIVQIMQDGVTEALDSVRDLVLSDQELSVGVTCLHVKLPARGTLPAAATATTFGHYLEALEQGWKKAASLIGWQKIADSISKKTGIKLKTKGLNRNKILLAILGAILLLILSVTFLMNSSRDGALRDEYRLRIEAMNQDLHTANTKGYANEKETANAILDKVEKEARDILGTNFFRAEALTLLEKVQQTRDSINNTMRLAEVKPYADLSAKKEKAEALGFVSLDDNFYVYEYNTLFQVILSQVLDPKPIDETEVVVRAAPMEDFDLIAFLTQSGRIIEYDNGQFRSANTEDANWQPAVDMAAYGKYLYLLSPAKNQIFKYTRLRASYSAAAGYNEDADLAEAISMAIDGDIYVLKKGGEIVKIYKSKKQPFTVEDMAADISEATKIFTSIETKGLYILDPVNKKVIIVDKDVNGVPRYRKQVVFENLEDVQSLHVDKAEDKLYLLTKKAIYQIDI
ncbi:hypothetical protein JXA05_02575 [Candidatus Peregrinibacteria bacterium]|nr:hypothetical protein [Candidatus Peregrinibacteria bacterium]